MAKFNKNTSKADMSALTSNSVVQTSWYGKNVFSKKPPPRPRKYNSPKQDESADRMRAANLYATRVLKSEEAKALYAKGIKRGGRTSAHAVAVQDFLTAPVIHYISFYNYTGTPGDAITIKATDDFRVDAVEVKVIGKDGKVLEQGNAEKYGRKPFIWKYKTTVANKDFAGSTVQAKARDLPGNQTMMSVTIGEDRKAHEQKTKPRE